MGKFIPSFHFIDPADKLKPKFCEEVVNYYYYASDNRSLLDGKDVREIDDYSSGSFPMAPFKRMFKSLKNKANVATARTIDGSIDKNLENIVDPSGIDWKPLPLIPQKLNSAAATIQKIPIEIECRAQDALAMKKREEDFTFLKNKPQLEAEVQGIADQLGIQNIDLGSTKHSSRKWSSTPLGLNLSDPDQEILFDKLLYSLDVETAFEKMLQQLYEIQKCENNRLLETMDTLKYGVCCHAAIISSITGMPTQEYVYPGEFRTPISLLPDYSDNTHRIRDMQCTVLELFNMFGTEIGGEKDLEEMINGTNDTNLGYCKCNNMSPVDNKNFGSIRVQIKHIEVKSVDWIGIDEKGKSGGYSSFTNDPKKASKKIWMQNTYSFYWLLNTKHFFRIEKLPFALREQGNESYQSFSSNIFRSQKVSAVELSIAENKKAQIADIKLQHALIKSLPAGRYFDLKYMRGAVESLKDKANEYSIHNLITNLFEHNQFFGDTTGFDGKTDGNQKPVIDLPGGLRTEITGYIQTIINADQNIANFTGINPQLTGQSANPEGLVGLQKLLINSSINAIHYCSIANKYQYKRLFNLWGYQIQQSIAAGGKVKEGMINLMGKGNVDLIKGLDEAPLHNLTIKVSVDQREEERAFYMQEINDLKAKNVITTAESYILKSISNAKERFALLAIIEKRYMEKQDQIREQQFQQQQMLLQQQGQNSMQQQAAKTEGDIKKVYAEGEVDAKLMQLGNQLGMSEKQIDGLIKKSLQRDRNEAQANKGIRMIQAKAESEAQKPLL